jgi:hypothetical protein
MLKKTICTIGTVLLISCIVACSPESKIYNISKTLGINLHRGTILSNEDTHGGFLGDGDTYVELSFDNDSGTALADAIAVNTDWCAFPLSDNLQAVVYGRIDGDAQYGPFITDDNDATIIPMIEHGYYLFYDRNDECYNPKDDTELLNRSSMNFTIALYDTDNNKLYYYELDT